MEIIQGKAIFGGIAIGPISFFAKEQKEKIDKYRILNETVIK